VVDFLSFQGQGIDPL